MRLVVGGEEDVRSICVVDVVCRDCASSSSARGDREKIKSEYELSSSSSFRKYSSNDGSLCNCEACWFEGGGGKSRELEVDVDEMASRKCELSSAGNRKKSS